MSDNKIIENPCLSICILQEDEMSRMDYCIGCFRTVKEIEDWYTLTDEQREEIVNALPYREETYNESN